MPSLQKRLETLERSHLPKPDPAVDRVIVSQALQCLSTEQLVSLRGAATDKQQGRVREHTKDELAALAAYGSALDRECKRAGFKTIAEFERSSRSSH